VFLLALKLITVDKLVTLLLDFVNALLLLLFDELAEFLFFLLVGGHQCAWGGESCTYGLIFYELND
jgi:hypothetical protein